MLKNIAANNFLLYLLSPLVFLVVPNSTFLWTENYIFFWLITNLIIFPLGFLTKSITKTYEEFDTDIWDTIAYGLPAFLIPLSLYSVLGGNLELINIIFSVYLPILIFLIIICVIYKKNEITQNLRRLIQQKMTANSLTIMLGFLTVLGLILRWYSNYAQYPGGVDGQALMGLVDKISKYNSYQSFFVPELNSNVGAFYPPAFLSFAVFLHKISSGEIIKDCMGITMLILSIAPLTTATILKRFFKYNALVFIGILFTISSGFYLHMNEAGTSDSLGFLSNLITLSIFSRIDFGNIKSQLPKIALLILSLSLTLIANSIYFFYLIPGIGFFALYSTIGKKHIFTKFEISRSRLVKNVFLIIFSTVILTRILVSPIVSNITSVQGQHNFAHSIKLETKDKSPSKVLFERLQFIDIRNEKDTYLALIIFLFLIFLPSRLSVITFGSLCFIFSHLLSDWFLLNLGNPPDFILKNLGSFAYYIKDGHLFVPFFFTLHRFHDFSCIALDSFIFILYVFAPFQIILLFKKLNIISPKIIKNKIFPITISIIFLVSSTIFIRKSDFKIWNNYTSYPDDTDAKLVDFVKALPTESYIFTPKREFSFSDTGPVRWKWGWLGLLTDRKIHEERYLIFINVPGMIGVNKSKAIFSLYSEKYKNIVQEYLNFYSGKIKQTPLGKPRELGITHAIIPNSLLNKDYTEREDIKIICKYNKSVSEEGGVLVEFLNIP